MGNLTQQDKIGGHDNRGGRCATGFGRVDQFGKVVPIQRLFQPGLNQFARRFVR